MSNIPKSVRHCKHPDLVEWYHSYLGEKTKYINFFCRVMRYGYTKEEAIMPNKMGRKDLIKGKIDDKGRECTLCLEYKTRDLFHRSKVGINKRTGDCIVCRNKRKKAYRKRTNYKKDKAYNKKKRTLKICETITILEPAVGIYKVIEKKKNQCHILENIHTGELLRLDVNDGNPNYRKFYRSNLK